jgi:methionyl-tRNA formyltransferase
MKPKIVFMGTPDFAIPALIKVHEIYGISAVVTQPDKPKGRGQHLAWPAVKECAIELGIPVIQPITLKDPDFINELSALKPDIIVVIAFRILPPEVFELAKLASFNIHGSLLPKYRGAAPINWAIINGEKETGLTSFILKQSVDTGDVLLQEKIHIGQEDTFGDVYNTLSKLSAELTVKTIELILSGNFTTMPQDNAIASPAPKIFKEHCRIDWSQHADNIVNLIRGLSPTPSAYTMFHGDNLKILKAHKCTKNQLEQGHYKITAKEFAIGCADAAISITELQPAGKKAMKIEDFLRGYRGNPKGNLEE